MAKHCPALTRRHVLVGAVAAGAVASGGLVKASAADPKVLRWRMLTDITCLDPAFYINRSETDVYAALLDRLAEMVPGDTWSFASSSIVTSVEQVDPTHIAFTLKPGVMWTNGFGELTAEDVKYSFERIANPDFGSYYTGDWISLDHVEVIDNLSGVIVLKEPDAALWTTVLTWGSGNIVCKAAVEALPDQRFTTSPPAVSGPYQIREWQPMQRLVLERNPLWNGLEPYFDEIRCFPIEDNKTAELAFLAGELDFTTIAVSSVPNLEENLPEDARLAIKATTAYAWIGMNVDHEPFGDIRVRRAVQKAIDVRAIQEGAYFGAAPLATGIISPGLVGYRAVEPPYPDPDGARALLAEAGFPDGFKTTLIVESVPDRVNAAQIVQANVAEIGIDVDVIPMDSGPFWEMGLESSGEQWKTIEMVLNNYTSIPDAAFATQWFVPDQVGVWNWERWSNAEFGELDRKARAEVDPEKRSAMYVRMMDLMWEEAAYVPLVHEPLVAIYRDTIDPQLLPDGSILLRNMKNSTT